MDREKKNHSLRIVLLMGTSYGYGRQLIDGVTQYLYEEGRRADFEFRGYGESVPRWMERWHGDGIPTEICLEFHMSEQDYSCVANGFLISYALMFFLGGIIAPPLTRWLNGIFGWFGEDLRGFLTRWVMAGPTHHFALGVGHQAQAVQKVADVLGIECVWVQ